MSFTIEKPIISFYAPNIYSYLLAPSTSPHATGAATLLKPSSRSSRAGAIGGGVAGGIVGVLLIILAAGLCGSWWVSRRSKQAKGLGTSDLERGTEGKTQDYFNPEMQVGSIL